MSRFDLLRTVAVLAAMVCASAVQGQTANAIAGARSAMQAGVAAARAGNLDEAKRQFAKAVELTPTIAEGHAALGNVLLSLGDAKAAIAELETAHRLAPSDPSIDISLAVAKSDAGLYAEGVTLFREATSQANAPALLPEETLAFARALSATGGVADAETLLSQAVAQMPDSADLQDAYGTVLAQRGAMDQALPHFQRASEIAPKAFQPEYHLGVALLALNQPEAALTALRGATAAQPQSFDANLQLGLALSALHRGPEALQMLHRTAQLPPPANAQELYQLALALQSEGDSAGALPWFDRSIQGGKPTSEELTNYALARVQTGDAKGAIPLYERALALGPDTQVLREDFGVAYLQQNDLDHALEEFKAGLALDPSSASLHYDLGLAFKLKDNLPAAIPEFEKAAELDPSLPDPAYTLGVIYMQQGRFADAATKLKLATTLQPNNGDAWALLGSVLKDSGDPAGATEALKRAIALQPDQPSLHIQLAALEVAAGNREAAAADRKIAADLSRAATSRQRASFALKSGRSLLADGKVDDAIVQLLVAVQAAPNSAEAHTLLADAYSRQGKAADAAVERKTAASLEAGGSKQP